MPQVCFPQSLRLIRMQRVILEIGGEEAVSVEPYIGVKYAF
jgi:hypothetical protein